MRTLVLALYLTLTLCAGAALAADVYGVSATQKITPEQAPDASWSTGPLALQCARNEWEACQVVVRSPEALEGVSLALTVLCDPRSGVLPANLARLYRVEWVDINAPYEVDKPSETPDLRADPLVPVQPGEGCSLAAGRNLVFWVALYVPEATKPGSYSGQLKVSSGGRLLKALPVTLRVRSFALPRKPLLQSMIGFAGDNIYKAHGCKTPEDKERIIRLYFDEYIRARLSPFLYAPGTMAFNPLPDGAIKWEFIKGADGRPTGEVKLDFATFDREGRRYCDEQQAFSAFNFAPYLWTRRDKRMVLRFADRNGTVVERRAADGAVNPVFDQLVVGVFRGIAAHLAEQGWLDRSIYYVTDEPSDDDMPAIKEVCQLIRQADPRIRTSLTYDPANRPKLAELVDEQGKSLISVWIPYCTMYRQQVADEQRRKGADYWLYDVSTTCLIGMTAQTNRSIMWDIWRRGCHGYLYYLSTWWGRQVTPWDRPSFLLPEFTYRYRQGDGYFFYPPERQYNPAQPILDHVVPTIRWEMLREGAEDYDYLAMLQNLTQRAQARKLKVAAEGEAALKLAREMSEIMSGVTEGRGIRDLTFQPTEGWGFGLEEGWLQGKSGKQVDLPISFKTSLPDGEYRLILNVYDDPNYRDMPYSRFLVNGKPYASSGGMKGPVDVPTEVVTVKGGQCSFVLSSVADKYGVILYRVGLQPAARGERGDLYAVRAKIADAIEHLQAALK
ncbi:DUF4091 domain-containing protein [bacterium]|nr:DUF4091 domain-containing protein [bacterium]